MGGKLICTCEKLQGAHQPGCVLHPEMMQGLIGTLADRIEELEAELKAMGGALKIETYVPGQWLIQVGMTKDAYGKVVALEADNARLRVAAQDVADMAGAGLLRDLAAESDAHESRQFSNLRAALKDTPDG